METTRKIFQVLENNSNINNDYSKLELKTITTNNVQIALQKTKPSAHHLVEMYKSWQNKFGSV